MAPTLVSLHLTMKRLFQLVISSKVFQKMQLLIDLPSTTISQVFWDKYNENKVVQNPQHSSRSNFFNLLMTAI